MQSLVASESGLGNGISQPQKYQNPDGHWYWDGERIYMYYVFTWCKIVLLNPHADELPDMVNIILVVSPTQNSWNEASVWRNSLPHVCAFRLCELAIDPNNHLNLNCFTTTFSELRSTLTKAWDVNLIFS